MSQKISKENKLIYWLWPMLAVLYIIGNISVGWNDPRTSLVVLFTAMIAFFGLMRLDKSLISFLNPKDPDNANGFQVYYLITKAFSDSMELMAILFLAPILFAIAYIGTEFGGGVNLPHFHMPWEIFFTIIGIMSAANNAMNEILSNLDKVEKKLGKYLTLITISLLASLTGEPANAAIQIRYLTPRVSNKVKDKSIVAVGMAGSIGSGGGLTFFSPPAILIIWGTMTEIFNWSLLTLLLGIGTIAIFHVIACVAMYAKYLSDPIHQEGIEGDYTTSNLSLSILGSVIVGHIIIALPLNDVFIHWAKYVVFGTDILLGFYCLGISLLGQRGKVFSLHRFEQDFQPILIGLLLVAIETIGTLAEPGVNFIGGMLPWQVIPIEYLPLMLALIMFLITGIISAGADNALATKVFILIPIGIAQQIYATTGDIELASLVGNAGAIGVIIGALTWGWMTLQGNLPNFPIFSAFLITVWQWIKYGLKYYGWTLAVAAIGIVFVVQYVLPYIVVPMNF